MNVLSIRLMASRTAYRGTRVNPRTKSDALPVAIAVLVRDGHFLVARRATGLHLGGFWEFPGGKVEPGEEPLDALRREVGEETGLAFGDAVLLSVEEYAYPDRRVLLRAYLCLDPRPAGAGADSALDPEGGGLPDGDRFLWVDLEELRTLSMPPANSALVALLAEQFGTA
jgi:8-oxo-dGTP diphosphatase